MTVFLETERMVLRRFGPDDGAALAHLHGDPMVMRFVGNGKPEPADTVRSHTLPSVLADYDRLGGLGLFAAERGPGGEFLGWFEFRPPDPDALDDVELGYRLHRSCWGRGLATEGARALVDAGFRTQGVRRVFATTMAVNHASRRVMTKVGLRYVRTFLTDHPEPIPGSEYGDVEYELTIDGRRHALTDSASDPVAGTASRDSGRTPAPASPS